MVAPVRGVRDSAELAWKRLLTDERRSALRLVLCAVGLTASWSLAARALVGGYRPELLGLDVRGESSEPAPFVSYSAAFLVLVGVPLAAALAVLGPPRPRGARTIATALAAVVLLVAGAGVASRSEPRCSTFGYTGETTCASRSDVLTAELGMVLAPGAAALGCLAIGGSIERREARGRLQATPGARARTVQDSGHEAAPIGPGCRPGVRDHCVR